MSDEKGLFSSAAKMMVSAGRWAAKVKHESRERFGRQYWPQGPEHLVCTMKVIVTKLLEEIENVCHDNTGERGRYYKSEAGFGKLLQRDVDAIHTILMYRQDTVYQKMNKGQLLKRLTELYKEET